MSEERFEVTVLGRVIGTSTGWDEMENCHLLFYDFQPAERYSVLPEGDLGANFNAGVFEYHDNEGTVIFSADIVKTLS